MARNRVVLTNAQIAKLPTSPKGKRREYWDALVPCMICRVTDTGHKSLMLKTRFPGKRHPIARLLGVHGQIEVEAARKKARRWLELIERGIDPAIEEDKERRANQVSNDNTFEKVAEEWLRRHMKGKRKEKRVAREVRRELVSKWLGRPVCDITRTDVVGLVEAIADRPAPYQAHIVFGHARGIFNWAINRGVYQLQSSPCDRLKPAQLFGAKKPRQRSLSDDEVRAFWAATETLGYPAGPMYRALLLTGSRLKEVSDAHWREVNLDAALFTIPRERFKSNAVHMVPLSKGMLELLEALPRFKSGAHLFSATFGATPIQNYARLKARLDKAMLAELRKQVLAKGEDTALVVLEPWVNHDLRRTVRTHLSALRIPEHVAEMVIGHGRKGLARIYDQHKFLSEMREGLEAWAARLRSIVEPPPSNVVPMRAAE